MGRLRQQSQSQVLQAHARRPQATRIRSPRVGTNHGNPGALPLAGARVVMPALRSFFARLAGVFTGQRRDRELTDELESHLQLHIDDNLRRGMSPEEARREALIQLGGVEQTKEIYREQRGLPMLETLMQDLRFGARMLRKNPGFTTVAGLTLALGIGANTAIFTLLDSVMLRSVPVRDPAHLFVFQWTARALPAYEGYSSYGGCFDTESNPPESGCSFSTPAFNQFRSLTNV